MFAPSLACTINLLPLVGCMHSPKGKRKESAKSNKERGKALKAKEGYIKNYKFLLSLQSGQGVA